MSGPSDPQVRLLLVDDTATVHQTLGAMLRRRRGGAGAVRHYAIDLVQTTDEGLRQLVLGGHDCYLVDHQVAADSGVDMIRRARALGINAPIIMLTSAGVVEDEAAAAGANDFLIKGAFDTPTLERSIRYAMGNADAQRRLADLNASLEEQVIERTRQLTATNERLVEQIDAREKAEAALLRASTLEALGRMTGGVAHDFNNVLTALLGSLELLETRLGPGSDARLLRPLGNAREAARRGERMVEGLLAFARRRPVSPTRLDVNAVIAASDEILRLAAGRARIVLSLAPGLRPVEADRDHLERALVNLVTNARDATEGGAAPTIEIATRATQAGLRLHVADNGPGMAPDVLERAFEPLFSTKTDGRGTGLGLAQVYGFVQASGGAVQIENDPGRGLAVVLLLPAAAETGPSLAVGQAATGR